MKKQQQETAEMTAADKMYIEARKALGKEPLTLEHFAHHDEDAQAFFSLHRITEVIKARKAGHKFNWDNSGEWKWSPFFDMRTKNNHRAGSGFAFHASGYVRGDSHVGSRLSSVSSGISDEIAQAMEEDYKNWFTE